MRPGSFIGTDVDLSRPTVGGKFSVTVYEFRACDDLTKFLYIDNEEIGNHKPGEVAAIEIDGVTSCWRMISAADKCKTGICAKIVGWVDDCETCEGCFLLTPCEAGTEIVVKGAEWLFVNGLVVNIAGSCYTVSELDDCIDLDPDVDFGDIDDVYADCAECAYCYELTPCDDTGSAAVIYIKNNLALQTGVDSPEDVVGQVWSYDGTCYTVTAYQDPCTETAIYAPYFNTFPTSTPGGLRFELEGCAGCCYILIPCEGQVGEPYPNIVVIPDAGDIDLWEFVEHELTIPPDPDNPYYASNGKVLMLASGLCYSVVKTTGGCIDPILGLGSVLETYEPRGSDETACADCGVTCWKKCGTSTYIRTYSAEVLPYAASGVALKRAEDGFCYEYEPSLGTCGTPAIGDFTIEDVYVAGLDSCAVCLDPRYKLVPSCPGCTACTDEADNGTPITDLPDWVIDDSDASDIIKQAAEMGGYVKIDGICYEVDFTTDSLTSPVPEVKCATGPYQTCALCAEGRTILTLVVFRNGEITGLKVEGTFKACGTVVVTEECGG
jgi:hypothetical protein